jgi:hypothetical protein
MWDLEIQQVEECLKQNANLRVELNELRTKQSINSMELKRDVTDENENSKLQVWIVVYSIP